MTKRLVVASVGALLALAACGGGEDGGGGGGGGEPGGATAANPQDVATCLSREKQPAKIDKAGARLLRAPKATDAIVAGRGKDEANIIFFRTEEEASTAKDRIRDSKRVNLEQAVLIVFARDPDNDLKNTIEDCLPGDPEKEREEEQAKDKQG